MIFPATGSSQILRRPASTDRPYRRLENWTAGLLTLAARCFVPLEVIEQSQDRPFAALVLDVKAVTQITGSFP